MDYVTYENQIWNIIIKPNINRMLENDNDILFTSGQIKENIWLAYEKYKNTVHTYMHNPDGRIDRHKIASVMLYSIIANKPFDIKFLHGNQKLKVESLLANEILAFNAALSIVWSFIMTDAEQRSDKIRIDIFSDGFVFPPCQHENYETHVYKMLYYSKLNGCYDIFSFSHVLFLIEAYTELKVKKELEGKLHKT